MFGHVEGKSRFTSKALSLKCGQRLACKDIFAKLANPLSTHRARNRSSSFAEFFQTEATKRVTAWGSHLRQYNRLGTAKKTTKLNIFRKYVEGYLVLNQDC